MLRNLIDVFVQYLNSIDRSPNTISLYKRDLAKVMAYLENIYNRPVDIEDISQEDLESFLRMLKEDKNYSCATRSRFFYTIRSLYKFANKKKFIDHNISLDMEAIKTQRKERIYIDEYDIKQVINAVQVPVIKLLALFMFNTGLRISECLKLTVDDVDLQKKLVFVKNGKGNKDRIVPINNELLDPLCEYINIRRDVPGSNLFFGTRRTSSLSYSYVVNTIKSAAQESGITQKVTCHTFRHAFASTPIKKKVGIVHVSKLLGHSNLAVTSIYTHLSIDQLVDAVNTINSQATMQKNDYLWDSVSRNYKKSEMPSNEVQDYNKSSYKEPGESNKNKTKSEYSLENYLPILDFLQNNCSKIQMLLNHNDTNIQLYGIPSPNKMLLVQLPIILNKYIEEISHNKGIPRNDIFIAALVDYLKLHGCIET